MKIVDVKTYKVGNRWKNWTFVRVETDEEIHGVGEGSLNAFAATVESAIHELRDRYIGVDPFDTELLMQRMVRDVSPRGHIQMAAAAAIEVACWDIMGKATGLPVHKLMGGRVRDRVRLYANGWYQTERTPAGFASRAAGVVDRGFTALKFDPFGAAWRITSRYEEDLAIEIVGAVRDAVGPEIDIMIEGHNRFSVSTALRIADRLAEYRPAWFEEPVSFEQPASMVEVAGRSPVPVATGESFTSKQQFAELLSHDVVHILQPEPLFLGLWQTRAIASMADAHLAVVAPHNAQGPVCSAISLQLGACIPNFYVQESFDDFNDEWTSEIVDHPLRQVDGYVEVNDRPGLGIELDWERLERYPYAPNNRIMLFQEGWEQRRSQDSKT